MSQAPPRAAVCPCSVACLSPSHGLKSWAGAVTPGPALRHAGNDSPACPLARTIFCVLLVFLCSALGKGHGPGLGPRVDPTCPGEPCRSPAPLLVPEQTLAAGAPGMAGSLSSTNAGAFLTQMGRSAAFFPLYFIELVSVSLTYFIIHDLCIWGSAGFFGASPSSLGLLSLPSLKQLFKRKHVNRSRCQS